MTDSRTIEINILGQKMIFKSSGDPEVVREAVDIALLKIQDAEKRISRGSPHHVATVALLDLAEDYVRAKRRTLDYRRKMDEKSGALIELVESARK